LELASARSSLRQFTLVASSDLNPLPSCAFLASEPALNRLRLLTAFLTADADLIFFASLRPRGAELHRSLSSGPLGCRFPELGGAANVFALMCRPILIRAFPAQMPSPGVEYSRR
jgi:hypothetical protein